MPVPILILNFNGCHLLAQCLPSLVCAAQASRYGAYLAVVDNGSTDDSRAYLAANYPQIPVYDRPNLGLTSFNTVLAQLDSEIVLLMNNDVKLDEFAIDRLVDPLLHQRGEANCFMTAPQCRKFDGVSYEGLKTAIRWRCGLIQASCFYPGHETTVNQSGWTACAGPVMAIDRRIFLELGGFDPIYLPGRLEDLDLTFRAWLAGYHARYIPESMAYHYGGATFVDVLGQQGCDDLALRNTLLFIWKNLRHPLDLARHLAGLAARLLAEPFRALLSPAGARWKLTSALSAAVKRRRQMAYHPNQNRMSYEQLARERKFFQRFHPRAIDDLQRGTNSRPNGRTYYQPLLFPVSETEL